MGFSTSGAAAIVFLVALVSFGSLLAVGMNLVEDITDSHTQQINEVNDLHNEDIEITDLKRGEDEEEGDLVVTVANTGAISMRLSDLSFVIDGDLAHPEATKVDGNRETDILLPDDSVNATFDHPADEELIRVRVETVRGSADTEEG